MSIKYIDNNLITLAKKGEFDSIIHGCNCFCVMGAGIALQIAEAFPLAEAADNATRRGDKKKLGSCTRADIALEDDVGMLTVFNAYTQYHLGYSKDYDAIRSALSTIANVIPDDYAGAPECYRIGIPLIGAGIAGGDWNIIEKIVQETLGHFDVTVVRYKP